MILKRIFRNEKEEKNRVQSPTPGHSTYEIISADQRIQVLYRLRFLRIS